VKTVLGDFTANVEIGDIFDLAIWNESLHESSNEIGVRLVNFATSENLSGLQYYHLGPNQPPIQWVPGALSLEVKRPGREADHSPPSSAEVKECVDLYLHSPIRLHGVVLG
jgi:hypothetical protein